MWSWFVIIIISKKNLKTYYVGQAQPVGGQTVCIPCKKDTFATGGAGNAYIYYLISIFWIFCFNESELYELSVGIVYDWRKQH